MPKRTKLISRKLERFLDVNYKIFVSDAHLHYGMSIQVSHKVLDLKVSYSLSII